MCGEMKKIYESALVATSTNWYIDFDFGETNIVPSLFAQIGDNIGDNIGEI